MTAGGHRGSLRLSTDNVPEIRFSLPRIPLVTGKLSRTRLGQLAELEAYLAANFSPEPGNEPTLDLPPGCTIDWDHHTPDEPEPLLRIPLPKQCDMEGIFTTEQAYPDISNPVESVYRVSYLPPNDRTACAPPTKLISIPEYGLTLEWQNNSRADAYMGVIAGYEFNAELASFETVDEKALEEVSTRFYYIVVATPSAKDPHTAGGATSWDAVKLTINLDGAARGLRLPGPKKANWDFYREDIRDKIEPQEPGSKIEVEEVRGASWDREGYLYSINALDSSVTLPLGQYLLLYEVSDSQNI